MSVIRCGICGEFQENRKYGEIGFPGFYVCESCFKKSPGLSDFEITSCPSCSYKFDRSRFNPFSCPECGKTLREKVAQKFNPPDQVYIVTFRMRQKAVQAYSRLFEARHSLPEPLLIELRSLLDVPDISIIAIYFLRKYFELDWNLIENIIGKEYVDSRKLDGADACSIIEGTGLEEHFTVPPEIPESVVRDREPERPAVPEQTEAVGEALSGETVSAVPEQQESRQGPCPPDVSDYSHSFFLLFKDEAASRALFTKLFESEEHQKGILAVEQRFAPGFPNPYWVVIYFSSTFMVPDLDSIKRLSPRKYDDWGQYDRESTESNISVSYLMDRFSPAGDEKKTGMQFSRPEPEQDEKKDGFIPGSETAVKVQEKLEEAETEEELYFENNLQKIAGSHEEKKPCPPEAAVRPAGFEQMVQDSEVSIAGITKELSIPDEFRPQRKDELSAIEALTESSVEESRTEILTEDEEDIDLELAAIMGDISPGKLAEKKETGAAGEIDGEIPFTLPLPHVRKTPRQSVIPAPRDIEQAHHEKLSQGLCPLCGKELRSSKTAAFHYRFCGLEN